MSLQSLKIGPRLALALAVVIVSMFAVTGFAIHQVQTMNRALAVANDVNSVMQRHAINFRGSVHDRAIALRDVVMLP